MLGVGGQVLRAGLRRFAILEEEQTFFASRHRADKLFSLFQRLAQTLRHGGGVDGFGQIQIRVVVRTVTRVAADLGVRW